MTVTVSGMCALLLVLLLCGLTQAQGMRDPWDRMQRFDTNEDGKVSREEFTGPDRIFDRMDADKDGFVTKEEAKNMRRGRGGRGGGAGGGMGGRSGGQDIRFEKPMPGLASHLGRGPGSSGPEREGQRSPRIHRK